MNESETKYVFDTSAWLTLIEDELGAATVQSLLESISPGNVQVLVCFMNFMEVFYITAQERAIEEAKTRLHLMEALPINRFESSPSLCMVAAELKAKYRLSVADAWIAALAKENNAILVHKDPEFEQIQNEVQLLNLPYKT